MEIRTAKVKLKLKKLNINSENPNSKKKITQILSKIYSI